MGKLSRITQRIFGSTAGSTQIAQFGSLAAGSPNFTQDAESIQALSNYLQGWFGAVIGGNSPAIEDLNAIHFVDSRQLAYLFQSGMPEYDASTTYYQYSFVQDGSTGTVYQSAIDNNTGNTPGTGTQWVLFARAKKSPTIQTFNPGSGTYTTPAGVQYLKVVVIGAGGGGAANGGSGSPGGLSSFGSILSATGGAGGNESTGMGGGGGSGSVTSPAIGIGLVGGGGSGADQLDFVSLPSDNIMIGGAGGNNPFGGAGTGAGYNSSGSVFIVVNPASSQTGAGGGGGAFLNGSTILAGFAGGGAGGYVEAIIQSPAGSYPYVCGQGGPGGTAGGGVAAGGGGSGLVYVTEYYQ